MKRNFLLFGSLFIILLSACTKQSFNAVSQATIDDNKIQAYVAANHLNVTKDPSGIYYQIITTNPGPRPTATDTVQFSDIGKLLNGGVFDTESVSAPTVLNSYLPGFQTGVELIGANGQAPYARVLIIIPSRLGYGSVAEPAGSGVAIPANSVLIFTVDLIGFY